MKKAKQMSESIRLGMLLAVSGGFMDAYSYIERDHVFANAQTGNMLLLGVNLSEGNFRMVILAGVAFFPLSMNLLANSLTSFACGIQVESFRKIRGNSIATTMCIGNMRSGTQNLCNYFQSKDIEYLRNAVLYFGIILCFVIGAVIGNFSIQLLHEKAILCCSVLLVLSFIMMFIDYEKGQNSIF